MPSFRIPLVSVLLLLCAVESQAAMPLGKAQIYGLRMEPYSQDAENFTRASWGGGLNAVIAVPQVFNLFAATTGVEYTNFLSRTEEFIDPNTQLRIEQQTDQGYFRFYVGGRVGPHGNGFLRPYVGSNIAFVHYSISTDVVIPDDDDPENEIRQHRGGRGRSAFGWDLSGGIDWNIANKIPIETGVRYLKSFNVPQQLGEGAVSVHPEYIQFYVAVGVNFGQGIWEKPRHVRTSD